MTIWNDMIKFETFQHYCGGVPHCRCCDESTIKFLHLDHVDGGGQKLRKGLGIYSSSAYYYHLRSLGYPSEPRLQVLCANCNMGKGSGQYCPHEVERGISLDGRPVELQTATSWRKRSRLGTQARLKLEYLNAYSNNNPVCTCCREHRIPFLHLEHINNNGAEHRRLSGKSLGRGFYYWLKKQGWPNNEPFLIQIMCANCNSGKKDNNNVCPHYRRQYSSSRLQF